MAASPSLARQLVTEQSLRAELANAKDQIRRLVEETQVLRERVSRQLGMDADMARGRTVSPLLDQLEQRASELEADNHRLREHVSHLEREVRELTDTLDAARAMNRELMNELNRSDPRSGGGGGAVRQRAGADGEGHPRV